MCLAGGGWLIKDYAFLFLFSLFSQQNHGCWIGYNRWFCYKFVNHVAVNSFDSHKQFCEVDKKEIFISIYRWETKIQIG